MGLKKNVRQPLYMQLMAELKNKIYAGNYSPGEKIPTETELEQIYGVSRITIRKCVEELCSQGVLEKQQGKGTFVKAPKLSRKIEMKKSQSFTKTCLSAGVRPSSHVLMAEKIQIKGSIREFLKLDEEEEVWYIKRLMSADDIPVIQEELYLPVKLFGQFDAGRLENGSLTAVVRKDLRMDEDPLGVSKLEAGNVSTELSQVLKINPGDAVLQMTTYWSDSNDRPLFVGHENIVGGRYSITI